MKIIVLQGSPHKNGSSNLLAQEFVRGAKEAGHSVQSLDVAHMEVHPCFGCGHCGMSGPCAHEDDNSMIREALLGADMGMVLGTGCGDPDMTRGTTHMEEAFVLGRSL